MKERHRTAINEEKPMLYELRRQLNQKLYDDEQFRLRMYDIIEDPFR